MKEFGYFSFRLASSSPESRLVYSLFLVFAAGGLLTNGILQFQRIGFGYDRIVAYYLGGEINGQVFFPKNFAVLLETAHFHTFVVGITFLILSHLFIATSVRRGVKYLTILLTFFSSILDIGSVWLIRYLSPIFAYSLMAAWIGMWLGYVTMIFTALYEMWLCGVPNSK
ncbi:MAG: hypothetical protein ACE5JU_19695 [Candidatus Binatia bacterium]